MSLINYTKYKISIDPKSKKVQGLQAGDIVRRQYFDGKNVIYSLMAVIDTGIDKVANEKGVLEDSPYFVGALLDGDIPSSDQVLDFARMTNLFNADRSGALYLTASDSEAPYMSVLDKLGTEKSLCLPFLPGNAPSIASKDKYHAILNSNGTYSYKKYLDGAYRVFSINKTSSGNARIKTTFEDTLVIQNVVVISYKIKATKPIASLPFKFGYTDDSKYEAEGTINASTAWEYRFHLVNIDQVARNTRSFTIFLDNVPTSTTVSIAELNIIKLSDIANFTNANKATIGKIGQIVDPVFGTLKGYGVYSQNFYATQNVGIAGTLTAGDENGFSSTFYAGRIQKNLVRNSMECDFRGTAMLVSNESLPARIGKAYKFTTDNIHTLVCREAGWASANKDKVVTFSIWLKGTKDLSVDIYQNTNLIDTFNIEAGWRRYTTTFPVYSTAEDLIMRFETTEQLIVCSPQLEFGEYATQYQPTDDTLSDDSESYGFWACKGGIGGTIQNPLLKFNRDGSISSKNDSFVINNDGTGHFSNGRFAWTEDAITLKDITIRWEDLTSEAQDNISSKSVKITGRNVFYYDKDGNVDNNQTTLEAEEINIVPTSRKWEYLSSNGSWVSAGSTSTSLLLSDTSSIWNQKGNLSIKYTAIANDKEYHDHINVYKVHNGTDGIDGVGISSIKEEYAVSSSKTTQPTTWYDSIQQMTPTNKYLWNKETIKLSDNSTKVNIFVIGVYGDTGATGNGISSVVNYYLASNLSTGVTVSATGWNTDPNKQQTSSSKKYLWNYEKVTYTNGNFVNTTPSIIGQYSADGIDGNGISNVKEEYAVSSSSTTVPTSWQSTVPAMSPTNKYLWNRETVTMTKGDPVISTAVIGVYGDTGATGNGISSIANYYLATTASSGVTTGTSGWSTSVPTISASKPYLWGYELIAYTNSTSKTTTPHIIGHFGKDGTNGKDANLLDWVSEWNNNKTEINGNHVITPKIFTGTKNTDGTLTGLALGNLPLKVINSSGSITTQNISGIYGFNRGKNTWFFDSNGNAQLGNGNQYIKYNSSTGKVEFGDEVVLGWGNIDSNGIEETLDNRINNSMFTQYTKNSDNSYDIDGVNANGVKVTVLGQKLIVNTSYATDSTVSQYYVRLYADSIYSPLSFQVQIYRISGNGDIKVKFGESGNKVYTKSLTSYQWTTLKFENITDVDSKYIYIGFTGSGIFHIQYPMLTNSINAREWRISNDDTSKRLTKITSSGIYTGTLEAEQVITATLKADSIQTEDLQAKLITADIINALELTTQKGTIGGWKIDGNSIYTGTKQTSNNYTTSGITIYSAGTNSAIRSKNFRIETDGAAYFRGNIEAAKGLIGGWEITNKGLKHECLVNSVVDSVIYIDSNGTIAHAKMTIVDGETYPTTGEQYTFWRLSKDGSGCLAKGNIKWDKEGKVTFGEDVTVNTIVDTSEIKAIKGTIGGWKISGNSIYTGIGPTYNGFATSGITLYSNGNDAAAISSPQFRIDTDGYAYFKGKLEAASGSFSGSVTATEGKIGGWNIDANSIYSGTKQIYDTYTTSGITIYSNGSGKCAIRSKKFLINNDGEAYFSGNLVAATGDFSGEVTAEGGSIGGWTISKTSITKSNVSLGSDGSITNSTKWKLNSDGSGQLASGNIKWEDNGSVEMKAVFRSLGNKTEMITSSGFLRIEYNGTEVARLSVNESTGMPELNMINDGKSVFVSPEKIIFGLKKGGTLSLNPENIGSGTIARKTDGTLYLSNNTVTAITVGIYVSPAEGGTTSPAPGSMIIKTLGDSEYVEAIPNFGYKFVRWSDGGAQRHLVTWDSSGKGITAYFSKIETTTYTVTLQSSPTSGGSVSGGGTFEKGTSRTISATANSGYNFVRWSDGGSQSHSVTWDSNKTVTAYFEQHTITNDEIFLGTSLTSTSYWNEKGSCSISSVSNGVAILSMIGDATGNSFISFNLFSLDSKLKQGHRYRLKLTIKASQNDVFLIAIIGSALDVLKSISEDLLFFGESVNGGSLSTSYKYLSAEFTATRNSSILDGLLLETADNCTVTISSISLKEI